MHKDEYDLEELEQIAEEGNNDESAKQGRRARRPESGFDTAETIDDAIVTQDEAPSTRTTRDSDAPPRPSRRKGGWGEEKRRTLEELDDLDRTIEDGEKLADFERRRPPPGEEGDSTMLFQASSVRGNFEDDGGTAIKPAFGDDDDDDEIFGDRFQSKANESSDDEPDIPVIPELGETEEEDQTAQVAVAPNVVVNRVATYRELDNDLLRHAQFLTLDNEIDLKLLSKGLSAEQDIFEEDAPWDWERLFTEVTSELLTEWEKGEAKEQEEAVA